MDQDEVFRVLSGPGAAVIVTEPDGVIERWSRSAEAVFGWPAEMARGRSLADVTAGVEERASLREAVAAISRGDLRVGGRTCRRPDGSPVAVLGFASLVEDRASPRLVLVAVATDEAGAAGIHRVEPADRSRWQLVAERALARLALQDADAAVARLSEFSRSLADATDLDSVVERVAAAAAAGAGTSRVSVYLRSETSPDRLELAGTSGIPSKQVRGFRERELTDSQSPNAVAVRTGHPVWIESADDKSELFPTLAERVGGLQALAVMPLVAEQVPFGTIALSYPHPRRFPASDRLFLAGLADVAAQAVARAQVRVRERDLVATLQRAVLPAELPVVAGVEVSARYLPADDAAGVGGDWWDAFVLPDGRLGLAVGDVAGHGLAAAGAMAKLRNGLRAYLFAGHAPGEALGLAEAFLGASGRDVIATAAAAVLDPATGRLTWARAGHLPPLLIQAGAVEYLADDRTEPLIGIGQGSPRGTDVTRLEPGATLTLFTDGLVESRRRDVEAGLRLLRQVAAQIPSEDPGAFCDELIDRLAPTGDDVCVLVLAFRGT